MKMQENKQIQTCRFTEQGERLRKCLSHANIKQKDLAEALCISPQAVSDYVRGIKGLPAHHVDTIADLCRVRREYLLLKSDYMTEAECISDLCRKQSDASDACLNLLAALGIQIIEQEPHPLAHTVTYRVITPEGKHLRVTQGELNRTIRNIQAFARFQIENPI